MLTRLDELGRGAWIAIVVLGFWLWWPIGLATLLYLGWGRRMMRHGGPGRWYMASGEAATANGSPGGKWGPGSGWGEQRGFFDWGCGGRRERHAPPPSGNRAFDEYRTETLKRLEEEQKEFVDYLERLRQARDKSEFDAFMAERRRRGGESFDPPATTAS